MTSQGRSAIDGLLAESFKELAAAKPIEKITIKEITDRAGVIRPTFYNHFQDKYELLEWIVRSELVTPMLPFFARGMVQEGITLSLNKMQEDDLFYQNAVRLEGQNSFAEILQTSILNIILNFLNEKTLKIKMPYAWMTPERIAKFYAGTLELVITEWVRDGMDVPIDELVDVFIYMVNHSTIQMLVDMKEVKTEENEKMDRG